MRRFAFFAALVLLTAALTGCGRKGPLFLPPTRPGPTPAAAATTAPVPATTIAVPAAATTTTPASAASNG